ncbi:transposase [Saccharothrix texasensis]|uniref:transposase n=1 Tax=Saccharothrix texasensis TaxID=103734 RepID=UPI003CCC4F9C
MLHDHLVREKALTDELWARLEPLIPVRPRRFRHPGRRRSNDRAALEGILYAVRTDIGWNRLPTALFGASGATCWRRLTEWHEAGGVAVAARTTTRRVASGKAVGPVRSAGRLHPPARPQRGDHTGPSPVDRRIESKVITFQ